jgi:hypothetical protein
MARKLGGLLHLHGARQADAIDPGGMVDGVQVQSIVYPQYCPY